MAPGGNKPAVRGRAKKRKNSTRVLATTIDIHGLRALLDRGDAQLVEVLPAEEYEEEHLPGAINLPLKQLDAQTAAVLARERPVIVYCWDYI